jgi:hypothetical protein
MNHEKRAENCPAKNRQAQKVKMRIRGRFKVDDGFQRYQH